jgi:hypothetical protein
MGGPTGERTRALRGSISTAVRMLQFRGAVITSDAVLLPDHELDDVLTGAAASASQMGRFETKWLSRPETLAALADLPGDKVHRRRR